MSYNYSEIVLLIKGAQLVANSREYWQEKVKDDVLNAIFSDDDLSEVVQRRCFEVWLKKEQKQ